jgi:histidine triad (HIT) family protein
VAACVFCGILAGEEPASVVAADERVVAFADILPVGEGHTLVVPRRHAVGLHDLDPEDAAAMMRLGQRIASAQRRAGLAEGVNLFLADGMVAGQEVFHAHLHVLPRREGDALRLQVDYAPPPSRETLDEVAARLRDALGDPPASAR